MLKKIKKIYNENKSSLFFKNLGWLFFDKIFRMGLGLILGIWIARYLGVSDFGNLNYALAISSITGVFATMGIDVLVIKKIIEDYEHKYQILSTAFFIKLIGAFLSNIFTLSFCLIFNEKLLLPMIISFSTFFQAADIFDFYNQSKLNSKLTVVLRLVSFLISSILKIVGILMKLDTSYFALLVSFEFLVTSILFFYKSNKKSFSLSNFSIPIAKFFIKTGFPILLSSFTVMIYMKVDQIMIGKLLSYEKVGIYSAAVKIAEIIYFLPTVLCTAYFPKIIEFRKLSQREYHRSLSKFYFLMFWLSVICTFIIFSSSEVIIFYLYGEEFKESGVILKYYSLSTMFVFMGGAITQYLLAENLTHIFLMRTILATLINLCLNIIFLKYFGLIGAVYSTFITYFIGSFGIIFFPKTFNHFIFVIKSILNPRYLLNEV